MSTDREVSVVVIGTSWGGLNALSVLFRALPATFRVPVVVVQHRGREGTSLLAELLQDATTLRVREVEDKEPLAPATVFLAPADYHVLVAGNHLALTVDPPVRFSRPSIDVTFTSAADSLGAAVAGVVLTGANDDGARGLRAIVDRGGVGLVQDPATAESAIMPQAALRAVPEATTLTLTGIAGRLAELTSTSSAAKLR